MKTIYKYPLEVDVCTIELPVDSKVICVREQNNVPTVWIEQTPDVSKAECMFYVVPTGGQVPVGTFYVGTCFIGAYV